MKRLFAESGVDDEDDESVDGLKRAKDKQPVAFPLVNKRVLTLLLPVRQEKNCF